MHNKKIAATLALAVTASMLTSCGPEEIKPVEPVPEFNPATEEYAPMYGVEEPSILDIFDPGVEVEVDVYGPAPYFEEQESKEVETKTDEVEEPEKIIPDHGITFDYGAVEYNPSITERIKDIFN